MTANDNSKTVIIRVIGGIVSALINLGIGIYSAVILANNPKSIISTDVYGFTLTICILHFLLSIKSMYSIFIQSKKNIVSSVDLVVLGLFIWSAVILFAQDGNILKSYNPYYMVVFVYFIINVTLLGLAIIIVPCACCFACYKINEIDTTQIEETRKNLDAAIKECEMALSRIKNNTEQQPTTPFEPVCTNV